MRHSRNLFRFSQPRSIYRSRTSHFSFPTTSHILITVQWTLKEANRTCGHVKIEQANENEPKDCPTNHLTAPYFLYMISFSHLNRVPLKQTFFWIFIKTCFFFLFFFNFPAKFLSTLIFCAFNFRVFIRT